MKKLSRTLLMFFVGTLFLALGTSQSLSANAVNVKPSSPKDGLHRDGSAFVKEGQITQADRQAAADRARAKGFAVGGGTPATSGMNTHGNGGANK